MVVRAFNAFCTCRAVAVETLSGPVAWPRNDSVKMSIGKPTVMV